MIDLTVFGFGCSPGFPTILLVEDVAVFLAFELSFVGLVLLQAVEVFQE